MKKWKIAAAAACVCFLCTMAYAANAGSAGSSADPLITLSYLNGTFAKQVQTMVDESVAARKAEMEQALDKLIASGGSQTGTSAGGSVFAVVTLGQGQTLVMLRVGNAVCGSTDSVGLIDTTGGTNLPSGAALAVNHLYMVTISTRSVTATSDTVKVLVRGPYTVS